MVRPFAFLSRHRRWILGGWVLLALGGGGLLAARFRIDNSVGVWFPAEDPELRRYEAYLQEFGAWEWTLVLLETESIDDPRFRTDLEAMTGELAGLRHVRRAVSRAGIFPPPVDPGKAMIAGTGLSALLSRPGETGRTVVLLETANLLMREEPYRLSLVDEIDAAVGRYPSIRDHHVAGTSVVNAELNRAARRDMLVFFSLVGMLVTVLSLLLLRSWRDTAVLLAVAFSSAGTTLGLIVLCGYSLNMITIMLPTVLIALSVADVVHLLQAFHQERSGAELHHALDRVVRDLWLPCLGTTLTTVGGFLSLAGSSMLPIFQLAVFSAAGLFLTWLFTMGVAPLLLERLWRNTPPRSGNPFRALGALAGWEERLGRGWRWVLVGGALGSLMLFGLPRLRTDTDYVHFFRSGARLPAAYEAISAAGYPQTPLSLVLEAPSGFSFEDPANGAAAEAFEAVLLEGSDERLILTPFPEVEAREGGASAEGRKKRLTLLTGFLSGGETERLLEEVRAAAARTLPAEVGLTITGSPVLWSRMDTHLVTTQRNSVIVVSVVTFLVLLVVFRSLPLALLGWATSFLPVAFILGFMGFLGISLNFATVLIAGISLGLAVDDTIHFVHGYQTNRRRGKPPREAVAATLSDVGTRMILTSLILAGSFSCMVASDFLPSANFGAFTAITLLVALVADLTLLPLVLARGPEVGELVRRRVTRAAERARLLAGRLGAGGIERG